MWQWLVVYKTYAYQHKKYKGEGKTKPKKPASNCLHVKEWRRISSQQNRNIYDEICGCDFVNWCLNGKFYGESNHDDEVEH